MTPGPSAKNTISYPLPLARFFHGCHASFPWDLRDLLQDLHLWRFSLTSWLDLQCPPHQCQQSQLLPLFLHHPRPLPLGTVAPGPWALQVIGLCPVEMGGGVDDLTVYLHLPTTFHLRPNGWEPWATAHDDGQALPTSVGTALVHGAIVPCLPLLTIATAVPLLHAVGPGHVPPSLIGRHRQASPGDPLGKCRCQLDTVHLLHRHGDHLGAIIRPLAPGGCPLIAAATPPAPGLLLLAPVSDLDPVLAAYAPSLLPGIISPVPSLRNNNYCVSGMSPKFLNRRRNKTLTKVHPPIIRPCLQQLS